MKDIKLHVISFNVPYPPNYGGVIDVFYKIKALHELGIKIILHCYTYGREANSILEKYTEQTLYYKRNTSIFKHISCRPYIVSSRANKHLLNRLLQDDYPIFFEGIHTCRFLAAPQLEKRIKIVRTHNIENEYYKGLAQQEKNPLKRLFFNIEAAKLKNFEPILKHSTAIASISSKDKEYFDARFNQTFLLPPFHSNDTFTINKEMGKYALYHGSLDVVENITAALFLIDVFKTEKNIPLLLAGNNAHPSIIKAIKAIEHIKLIDTPSQSEMKKIISDAQINLLPTFQPTGVKLKLLETLYCGKHIICNSNMTNGTKLSSVCHIAESKVDFVKLANKLFFTPISDSEIIQRKDILNRYFNNKKNAQTIIDQLI